MNRPDLDAIESEIRIELLRRPSESLSDALEVIAYVRHLEAESQDLRMDAISAFGEYQQAFDDRDAALKRVAQLETALEPFAQALTKWGTDNDANCRYSPGSPASDHYLSLEKFQTAARVLRKGAQCDAITHETWCEDDRPCAYHDGPKAAP